MDRGFQGNPLLLEFHWVRRSRECPMVRQVLGTLEDPEDLEVPKVPEIRWVPARLDSLVIQIVQ